jgi:hypothetical protein
MRYINDMRYIKSYNAFNESLDSVEQMLTAMSKFGSGIQQELAKEKLKSLTQVECTPLNELFDEDTIEKIKQRVHPKAKECYANSLHTAECLRDFGVEYCEGYLVFYGIPIDHAFNKIGDKYFDVTQEIALGHPVDEQEYAVLGSWDPDTALMWMATGPYKCYGEVFNKEFFETHQENVK